MDPTEDDIRLESRFGVNKPFTQKQSSKIRSMVSRHLTEQIDACITSQKSKDLTNNNVRINYINESYYDSEVKACTKKRVEEMVENNKKLLQMRARIKDPSLSRTMQAQFSA
jgi:hypothetical protein